MAALRIFARGNLAPFLQSLRSLDRVVAAHPVPAVYQIQQRWSSYKSSPRYKSPKHYTDYDVTSDPAEWKYVERTLASKIIPEPPKGNGQLPSGYIPARASPKNKPYFVERTRNFMQPVYLMISHRGMKKVTRMSKIQGDIWTLEQDLRQYLEKRMRRKMASRIHEVAGTITLKGDYVNRVKNWLNIKGF